MKATIILCFALGLPVLAQDPQPQLSCEDRDNWNRKPTACNMRESTIAAPGRLSVDSGTNGGVSVKGWSRRDTLVRAKVQTHAPTQSEADAMQSQILVETGGGQVRANGPDFGRERGYSVTFEIFVPDHIDLSLRAHNGGIAVDNVTGRIEFSTTNGGASLKRLGGTVKGRTVNGGLNIELAGAQWNGDQLDAETTNGGVSLSMPANYSAQLEASTVNGGFKSELPITIRGEISKRISATLGNGGPLIRVTTTNGGIRIRQKS